MLRMVTRGGVGNHAPDVEARDDGRPRAAARSSVDHDLRQILLLAGAGRSARVADFRQVEGEDEMTG
jgi:hypothetical protein